MSDENAKMVAKVEALGLDTAPEAFIAALPAPIKRRVEVLKELQTKKDELEAQFRKERAELEAKYEALYGPLYQQRFAIVSGEKAVPPKGDEPAGEDTVAGIPDFWLTCLMKCDITADMVKEKDLDVLKHLKDITSEAIFEDSKPRGFKLRFLFEANPFFTNTVLEKTYFMLPEDDGVLERAEGTAINWNPGKDVTVKILKKKPKKGGKQDSKPQTKTEKVESFFNFFDPPQVPGEDEDVDEEQMEELQAVIEGDYEVGATIREKIISKAVLWFTGEAMEDEGGFFFGDDDDEDFEGEEGEEGEDDDDEDAAAGGDQAGAPTQQPPECKQQ